MVTTLHGQCSNLANVQGVFRSEEITVYVTRKPLKDIREKLAVAEVLQLSLNLSFVGNVWMVIGECNSFGG